MNGVHYVRLPLKNAYNVRDLGGYPCLDGGVTKWNTFLRGDDLAHLDQEEIQFLMDYGVKTVIDLRSASELRQYPDPFSQVEQVSYHNIPLMTGDIADATKIVAENPSDFIGEFYLALVRQEPSLIKIVLDTIAEAGPGGVLFHCTVGKDRTGIIAAMLLGIAGVATADIVSNYEVTHTYNSFNPVLKEGNRLFPKEVMFSKAEYLQHTIDYIVEHYGTFREYLIRMGICESTLQNIQERFVEPGTEIR